MRTTVDIPEDLLRAAKQRAAGTGQSLSRLVQQALRSQLASMEEMEDGEFELLVAGHPGGRAPAPEKVHEILDEEDWRRPR